MLSKSQANKLGRRISDSADLAADDLVALQKFRTGYWQPLLRAQALVGDLLGLPASARLKTINTIVEKLRRERTRLAEMNDIAGIRIVKEMGLGEQDELAKRVQTQVAATVVDRRSRPSHGYRALHLILTVDETKVELQIRTAMQDAWAQAFEKLADRFGREMRYGMKVPAAHSWAERLQRISDDIAFAEEHIQETHDMVGWIPRQVRRASSHQRELLIHKVRVDRLRHNLERVLSEAAEEIRELVSEIGATE